MTSLHNDVMLALNIITINNNEMTFRIASNYTNSLITTVKNNKFHEENVFSKIIIYA